MDENIKETSVQEVDSYAGYLITHHTRTWDTREFLHDLADKLVYAKAQVVDAQAAVDVIEAQQVQWKAEIDAAVAAKATPAPVVDTLPVSDTASSTPIM